ncbi:MAG: hypothetical protein AA908_09015 [Chlorobi bacterium NICIL-2]|nr:MAG: hypothetical protein AA908_09015 [Chlorobi bacterium NICIL-2]
MSVLRTSRVLAVLVGAALICTLPTACGSSSSAPIERITLGQGGGVTGLQTGYRIERSGIIEEWEIRGGSMQLRSTAKVPASNVRPFFARAGSLRLDTLHIDEPGNMTSWIEVSEGTTTHRLRWSKTDRLPGDVAEWYNALRSYCQQAIAGGK